MSRRNQEVKRQLFRGLTNKKSSNLDSATHNLLTRTLRKQSDKYKANIHNTTVIDTTDDGERFVIHKSTSPEDYKIFNSLYPMRESKLQAFECSEQAFEELFHRNGFMDDSGSEDEEPDLSSFVPPSEVIQDDILISVPGYSKEEITASKRLNINDRKNVRLSRVSDLERAFVNHDFLNTLSSERLEEYNEINREFLTSLNNALILKQQHESILNTLPNDYDELAIDPDVKLESCDYDDLRQAVSHLDQTSWMYEKRV